MNYTKPELEALTLNRFARNSITSVADEMIVVGKFCRCAYLGEGKWDVWLCNHQDIAKGLSTRKINNMYRAISKYGPDTGPLRKLTGEGYYPSMGTGVLLNIGSVLGIRKRRKSSGNIANFRRAR